MNHNLFDSRPGLMLRNLGLASVEWNNREFVDAGREILDAIIRTHGSATMDDVREVMTALKLEPRHPNTYGAIVKDPRYVCIGVRQSKNPSRRGGTQHVWAHEIPKLEMEPPRKKERQEYYFSPRQGAKEGPYRAQY